MRLRNRTVGSKGREEGNAIVESLGVILVLLVPALLATVSMADVLAARSGALAAAREGARAYVRSESSTEATERMRAAANLVLSDRGLSAVGADVTCTANPCLQPGATVSVTISVNAELPVLGRSITIPQTVSMPVDDLRPRRP